MINICCDKCKVIFELGNAGDVFHFIGMDRIEEVKIELCWERGNGKYHLCKECLSRLIKDMDLWSCQIEATGESNA